MVDDEPMLLEAFKQFLELDPSISVDTTLSASEALELITVRQHDIIVSDYQMPDMDGIQLLKEIRSKGSEVPFILFTGKGREEVAREALNSGADFYLQKGGDFRGQFAELVNMMNQAVLRRRSDQALRESEERYHRLFDNIGIGVAVYEATEDGRDFIIRDFNRGAQNIEKVKKEDVVGRKVTEVFPGIREMDLLDVFRRVYQTGNPESHPLSLYRDDRIVGYRENHVYRLPSGEVVAVYEDATVRKEAEARIEHLASFPLLNPDPVLELNSGGEITYANASAYRMIRELGHDVDDPSLLLPEDIEEVIRELKASGAERAIREVEIEGRVIQAIILNVVGADLVRVYETDVTERKRMEKVLRESESRYEQLAEHVGIVTWEVDAAGLYTYVSRVSETVWGYRPDELVGKKHFYDLTPETERESLKTAALGVFEAKERFIGLENSIATKEGRIITVSTNGFPLLNEDGTLRGYQGTDTDITESRKAEDALKESEKRYRLLVDSAAEAILVVQDGVIRLANPMTFLIAGFPEQEILSKPFLIFIHPDDRAMVAERHRMRMRGEAVPPRYTFRLLTKDGITKWVEISAVALEWEGRPATLNFLTDITERKMAELALRESERKYRLLAENVNDVIWIMDTATLRFTYVSPSVEKLSGFTVEETLHQTLKDLLAPDSYKEIEESLPEWIGQFLHGSEAGKARRLLVRQRRRDGTWIHVEVVATLLQGSADEPIGILGMTRDVTDRVSAERALQEVNKKLNLLSNISRHDIRNQLTALTGNLALLQRHHTTLRSDERYLRAVDAARRISSMIDFTQEYEEIGVRTPLWQDLRGLVEAGAADVALGSVKLMNDLPAGIEIFADPLASKAFHNLVDNAIRHGGTTTRIRFYSEMRDGHHVVICEDDGVGVPADLKERIFTYSAAKTHGLFLSQEVLSITGVTIAEVGEPGKGARFLMDIPPEGLRSTRG
ncbi:MAG: PAS domain S-box protein [Methanomassiliicoccales archaeon]|nr:PAS domain S-box protein [Methanomassiliicoccales archaeon]